MNDRPEKRLYRMLEKKGFRPTHVVEVGVWMPEMSNIFDYIEAGIRTTLVEPDHASFARIKELYGFYRGEEAGSLGKASMDLLYTNPEIIDAIHWLPAVLATIACRSA